MLKSRRGLLAAGLAVAVAGVIGVASTLNAGAAEIPGAPDPVADATTKASASTLTPPAVLPWGKRPTQIETGRSGADAAALHAAGDDAAPAEEDGSTPAGAPKGRSNRTTLLRSEKTDVPPPQPAGLTAKADDEYKATYFYGRGYQAAESDGAYANLYVAKPWVSEDDYHSLAEVSVQSADGKQIVEIGWTVDRLTNGDDEPHLFVYHWVNGESTCYNECGFVQYSSSIKPGYTLATGASKQFGIQYVDGAWWVAFDSEWVGYFPDSLWSDQGVKYTKAGFMQFFGEVAAASDTPCTDMGTGDDPSLSSSAYVSSAALINGPTASLTLEASNSQFYGVKAAGTKGQSFRYGGTGNDC